MALSSFFHRCIAPVAAASVALIFLFAAMAGAAPINYSFSGTISSYMSFSPSNEAGQYHHPEMAVSQTVDGTISWDTDLVPDYTDTPYSAPQYLLPMNGLTFMSMNIGGASIDFDYSYYVANVIDSDSRDSLHLYNLGTRTFEFDNQLYSINVSDFFFYGASDLFDGDAYPAGIDLALFQTARLTTTIDGFVDLSDNSLHNYLAPLQIDIDDIQVQSAAVPEPSKAVMMFFCAALLFGAYRFRRKPL